MAPRTLDARGRAYARHAELREGQRIELDDGFDCVEHNPEHPTTRTVLKDEQGLYFVCKSGKHYLAGQVEGDVLIGIYHAVNGCTHDG